MRRFAPALFALPLLLAAAPAPAASLAPRTHALLSGATGWSRHSVAAVGHVRATADPLESAGNVLAFYCDATATDLALRVSLVAPVAVRDGDPVFARRGVRVVVLLDEGGGANAALPAPLRGAAPFAWDRAVFLDAPARSAALARAARGDVEPLAAERFADHLDHGWLAAAVPSGAAAAVRAAVITFLPDGRELDRLVTPLGANAPSGQTNVAFVHHGNQGLAYSDVFAGRSGAEGSSGFDEVLRIHEQKSVPGNFHLAATLQSSAEWNHQNGDPLDFNGWLRAGVTNGWAAMLTSAYAQPIMPFLQGSMNDWAIDRDVAMVTTRYNYVPHVAWVPERCFLDPSTYPNAGVIDWSGAHWQAHGVDGVVVDDWPHCAGHNPHQIHFLQGNGLRLIPRDSDFTGRLHSGDGAGALAILTNEANSGVGQYRITVYADDWEMAAAVGGWETTFPYAFGTYQWIIDKCATESAWLHTWKLDAALGNPDFNGDTFTPTYGTYGGIGDVNGYGGGDNAWYAHWAGYVPYSTGGDGNGNCGGGGNCKNHGTLWNDAHAALQAAPDNKIRETGWYVLMTNLHETGWHDYLGGPLSGWERQYSAHIPKANVYAEAARWAGGLYANATGAFTGDVDDDGNDELVLYNDRLYAVFESIGGRCTQLFAKGADYAYSVVGIDNAYWAGTEGDFNDVNHVGALSDVGPNRQNDFYAMSVDTASGGTVQATFTHAGVTKTVRLTLGQPWLDCVYRVGANTQYVNSGFSPDVVDLLYNARLDRIWGGGTKTYMGQRDPNTGATAAYVLGGGGAEHNASGTSTLMKTDEIKGTQKFEFYLYGGYASPPDGLGHVAELEALAAGLGDALPPEAVSGTYFPATRQLALTFDEPVQSTLVAPTGIAIDDDGDGIADVTLDGACAVLTTGNAATITIAVSAAVHAAIQALADRNTMRLVLAAGAVQDAAGNPVAALPASAGVHVSYGPPTRITLDGRFDPAEWPDCAVAVADSFDSGWNAGPDDVTNEIQALDATWDDTYLYLGIRGVVTGNSWLLYLDTDPGGPNGPVDLTAIDAWERGATFSAPGFRPDWEFGAYQHQGAFDSQSFFRITSATTTVNYTDSILAAFDPMHGFGLSGGSEIAIPWSVLYGTAPGHVPPHAQLGMVASLCWDPEPAGQLGGDQAPNNVSAAAPALDNRVLLAFDANGDGLPDPVDRAAPAMLSATPTGYDSVVVLQFDEPLDAATAQTASRYAVYQTGNPTAALAVKSATLQPGNSAVRLVVSSMAYVPYTVVSTGVADATCWRNAGQATAAFQGPPVSVEGPAGLATRLELAAPWPNPTRDGRATFAWRVPGGGGSRVSLRVHDLAGRTVRTLVDGGQAPGEYRTAFDGRDERGERLAPGLYFVRLSLGASHSSRRLVVMP